MSKEMNRHEDRKKCEACGVNMTFIEGPSGRAIPCTRVKAVYIATKPEGALSARKRATKMEHDEGEMWISHFETCIDPQRFSRGDGKR